MSRNIIVAVAVIGTLTLSAATQERRGEIVTASHPAFTAVKRKLHDDEPPHVSIAGASAENAHVLPDLVAVGHQEQGIDGTGDFAVGDEPLPQLASAHFFR